ncbi:hypothetical protein RND71_011406 [Anisodus tanguticus]|uniref:Protein SPIRAL1-like 1 n=1 Tax=Anisodus tanguticus TaxID=243964 RepID=A0AAE1VNU5_9SOLA|nr:hypothetical protein RND71_011406 [Anisodus tanguticus]
MGRGVSAGGGQSSLGYLFGSGEPSNNSQTTRNQEKAPTNEPAAKPVAISQPVDNSKNVPAGIHNLLFCIPRDAERRSTKVQAAPGGGSSLGYLFGDGSSK